MSNKNEAVAETLQNSVDKLERLVNIVEDALEIDYSSLLQEAEALESRVDELAEKFDD